MPGLAKTKPDRVRDLPSLLREILNRDGLTIATGSEYYDVPRDTLAKWACGKSSPSIAKLQRHRKLWRELRCIWTEETPADARVAMGGK